MNILWKNVQLFVMIITIIIKGGLHMKKEIVAALITGTLGVIASLTTAILGVHHGEEKILTKMNQSIGEISGDNANVYFNNVDEFMKDYERTKKSNEIFATQTTDLKKEVDELKSQIGDTPIFRFSDLNLFIDGDEQSINPQNSMVEIDGRDYFDKEFIENILGKNRKLYIKDNNAYIGKVIKNRANLSDQWVVNTEGVDFPNRITDSYGNMYTNAIRFHERTCSVIYNLNKEYSLLKMKISMCEDADNINTEGRIIVKADDKEVYSKTITKKTKPSVEKDIPIRNCSLLTIEYITEGYRNTCLVSDAAVYN